MDQKIRGSSIGFTERKREGGSYGNRRTLYLYQKKNNRIRAWTAVNRNRLCFSAFEVGSGEAKTLRKLLDKLDKNNIKAACTNGNPIYPEKFSRNSRYTCYNKSGNMGELQLSA
ncbi:MAG: hypothetical protein LBF34_04710 [Puniceicoccales bacterium]|jgi:IS1 family transposase|nr:hypothetical protein [Puniceicoccales bacterium]